MAATSILTLLALMAVPYAQTAKDRELEVQLIDSLTRIREAIELFSWNESNGDNDGDGASEEDPAGDPDGDGIFDDDRDGRVDEDGFPNYPNALQELVDRGYLSAVPPDPFLPPGGPVSWTEIRLERESVTWEDGALQPAVQVTEGIFDVRSSHPGTALNGSRYNTW
jgi:hypothetical protein